MTILICEECGCEFTPKNKGKSIRFHEDACRVKWHNTQKRIARLKQRAILALLDLHTILDDVSTVKLDAMFALQHLSVFVETSGYDYSWGCRKCGQTISYKPVGYEVCSVCKENDWVLKVSKIVAKSDM